MWLTLLDQGEPKETVEVVGNRFTIGREEDCDLTLEDPKVSRRHAVITPGHGPTRYVHDLGSANGTLLNGAPLRPQAGFTASTESFAAISGGEFLQFGDSVFVATLYDPQSGPLPTDPSASAQRQSEPER
jgi:pSer/pThr/pTyr-binding forkhead associated (FHA) protein